MTVLAATDLSSVSDDVVKEAARRAKRTRQDLVCCSAVSSLVWKFIVRESAERATSERLAALIPPEVEWSIRLVRGSPHVGILSVEEEVSPTLIVLGLGEDGSPGSTVNQVARHARCCVLAVGPQPSAAVVLVATDLSKPAYPAVRAGVAEVAAGGALHVVHCRAKPTALPAYLMPHFLFPQASADDASKVLSQEQAEGKMKEGLGQAAASATLHVLDGSPRRRVLALATSLKASCLVLGAKGRSESEHISIGSEADALLRGARCSVLLARS